MDVAKNVLFNARSYQSAYLKWYRYSEEIKTQPKLFGIKSNVSNDSIPSVTERDYPCSELALSFQKFSHIVPNISWSLRLSYSSKECALFRWVHM